MVVVVERKGVSDMFPEKIHANTTPFYFKLMNKIVDRKSTWHGKYLEMMIGIE